MCNIHRRIRPADCPLRDLESFIVCHDLLERQGDNTLRKQKSVPILKPDFPLDIRQFVLVGAQDEGQSRTRSVSHSKFPLNG